ncbi:MAG: hypothetical protein NT116_04875 [Candidatus Parcubacteria bacterium]|nr:hypothetical protein [Candidatus Parcubacteria bacterium]
MAENRVVIGHGSYEYFIQTLKIVGVPVEEVPTEELKKAGKICQFMSGEYNCPDHCYGMDCCTKDPCPCCTRNCTQFRLLKIAHFKNFQGEPMVAEEILRHQECGERDCENFTQECEMAREQRTRDCGIEELLAIEFAIYPDGQRPKLATEVKPK